MWRDIMSVQKLKWDTGEMRLVGQLGWSQGGRQLCEDIVRLNHEVREQMVMFSYFQLQMLSLQSQTHSKYSCMGWKYNKTLF